MDTENERMQNMRFHHPRNIQIGSGRIIFDPDRNVWALPGRGYTRDEGEARHAAATIDMITKAARR